MVGLQICVITLKEKYHVVIPILDGHADSDNDFVSFVHLKNFEILKHTPYGINSYFSASILVGIDFFSD